MLLICILFFCDSRIGGFQWSVFFQTFRLSVGSEGKDWTQRASYLSFPFLPEHTETQPESHNLGLVRVVWNKMGASGIFQVSPGLCITFSICSPVLVFSFSASTDSISMCLPAQANSSSEALNILLLPSHLKETTIFLPLSFPCPHSRTKLRLQELHFCAGVMPQPHQLT